MSLISKLILSTINLLMAINVNIDISKQVFNPAYLPILNNDSRYEVIYGGAGSGKSYAVAQKKIFQHLNGKRNTMVVRQVTRTHRHSTFAMLKQVIYNWNVQDLFRINKSDLTITRLGGGQIAHVGLDDVEKLKSFTFDTGPLTDIWVEEASEMRQENDLEQLNLRLRGKSTIPFQMTLTFNPISALHFLKKRFFDYKLEDAFILKTTYKDNKFIDEAYKKQLEALKDKNPTMYDIYALGEWGVLGDLVYTNYIVEDFDRSIFDGQEDCGLDWGYNDPAAGIKIGFKDDNLYLCDELYVRGHDNDELMQDAESIFDKKRHLVIADNSEPKSIKYWRKNGWRIQGAKKGKDSVKFGIGWIRSKKKIIHPSLQNAINEITTYSYRKDKDGNTTEEPVDYRNHIMDAMRYALERRIAERKIEFLK